MDDKVKAYFDKQPSPQKEICLRLRELIEEEFPEIHEEMKWGVPTYGEGRYYIVALKDHVNIGFSLEGLTRDDEALFDGGGKTMKHVQAATLEGIQVDRIVNLLRLVNERQKP